MSLASLHAKTKPNRGKSRDNLKQLLYRDISILTFVLCSTESKHATRSRAIRGIKSTGYEEKNDDIASERVVQTSEHR